MFSHVMVGANDIEKSKLFYDKVLGVLGADEGRLFPNLTGQIRYFYFLDGMTFCISEPIDDKPATSANGSTIGFNVKNVAMGDKWHKAGVENGGESIEDPPGIRQYDEIKIYLAYLRDPSGNKLCAIKRL